MTAPLRILYLGGELGIGGASGYLLRKARAMRDAGNTVTVITAGGAFTSRFDDELGSSHFTVRDLRSPLEYQSRSKRRRTMERCLSKVVGEIDLVESCFPSTYLLADAISEQLDCPASIVELAEHLCKPRFTPCVLKWVSNGQLTAVYREILRSIERETGVRTAGLSVHRIPIDLAELERDVRTPADPPTIVSLARLDSGKPYLRQLVRDCAELAHERTLTLRLVGDGDDLDNLKSLSSDLARPRLRVEFPGPDFDVPRALNGCSVFVGQGTAAVQAAALGLPVVLAGVGPRSGRSPGFFGQDEELSVGEDFPGAEYKSYSEQIAHLLDDPEAATEIASLGSAAARGHFTVDAVVRQCLAEYHSLVEGWASRPHRGTVEPVLGSPVHRWLRHLWARLPNDTQGRIRAVRYEMQTRLKHNQRATGN